MFLRWLKVLNRNSVVNLSHFMFELISDWIAIVQVDVIHDNQSREIHYDVDILVFIGRTICCRNFDSKFNRKLHPTKNQRKKTLFKFIWVRKNKLDSLYALDYLGLLHEMQCDRTAVLTDDSAVICVLVNACNDVVLNDVKHHWYFNGPHEKRAEDDWPVAQPPVVIEVEPIDFTLIVIFFIFDYHQCFGFQDWDSTCVFSLNDLFLLFIEDEESTKSICEIVISEFQNFVLF